MSSFVGRNTSDLDILKIFGFMALGIIFFFVSAWFSHIPLSSVHITLNVFGLLNILWGSMQLLQELS